MRIISLALVVFSAAVSVTPVHSQVVQTAEARNVDRESLSDRVASQELELARLREIVSRQTALIEEQLAVIETPTPPTDDDDPEFPVEVHGLVQAWFAAQGDAGGMLSS